MLMIRSSSASCALMSDSLLLELVSESRRRGGEADMVMAGVKVESTLNVRERTGTARSNIPERCRKSEDWADVCYN